ncbi:MAG: HupE/UreJ family protein [Xanthobacteraceae bacterium]
MRYRGLVELIRNRCAPLAAMIAGALAWSAAAHEIPTDVKINAFVKPAGDRLELLIRVPLAAMIEVDFPIRGQGFLDVSRADEALRAAAKVYLIDNISLYENDVALPAPRIVHARVSLASDRSFTSYDTARAQVAGPRLADGLDLIWSQQLLDVLLEYPIQSDRSEFAVHPRVDRFGRNVSTALRFLPPGGAIRAFELHGDPGLVRLDPRWHHAALRFLVSGFWHILEGPDHLLFLSCLVIPFRRLRPLVIIVTSFTVGHSISLIASAFGFVPEGLWFPPLVETLIAVTIVYMSLENIVYAALGSGGGRELARRWIIAFAFGIVHGFGFSFALRDTLQFAGDHLLTALFGFNVGVEIGQLAVLVVVIPAIGLLFRYVIADWLGIIILSALVAHTGWHWMLERGGELAKFPFPTLDAAFLASAMRGGIAVLILVAAMWLANGWLKRWIRAEKIPPADDIAAKPPGPR